MPRILALDTSGVIAGVALLDGEAVVVERSVTSPDGYAHVIFDEIRSALDAAGWRLDEIDCFAAAAGPGSFTGIRVGLAAAKGLAEAAGRPMVAVSTLAALSWYGSGERRAVAMDAGRGEVYAAVYDAEGVPISAEVVAPAGEWPAPEKIAPLARGVGAIALREFGAGRAADPVGVDANYVRRPDAETKFRRSFEKESSSPVNAGPRGPSHE
jgi:tRNA threonylcarbamoyladenosine biosynthesis protein TsaB